MSMRIYVVVCCAVLFEPLAWSEDVPDRKKIMETIQAARIADADMKELSALFEDYARLSSRHTEELSDILARLRPSDGAVALTDGERRQTIAILKTYKDVSGALYAAKTERFLLMLGDSETIKNAVKRLSEGTPRQRIMVPDALARSKQPLVVTELANYLLVDEPVQPRLVGGEVRVSPVSVSAMRIMNQILVESDRFPEKVNSWARSLRTVKVEKRRELVRAWWNVNQEAMRKGDYMSTRPLDDAEQYLQPMDLIPQRRPVRRID